MVVLKVVVSPITFKLDVIIFEEVKEPVKITSLL
jgi:hypothetical protein